MSLAVASMLAGTSPLEFEHSPGIAAAIVLEPPRSDRVAAKSRTLGACLCAGTENPFRNGLDDAANCTVANLAAAAVVILYITLALLILQNTASVGEDLALKGLRL